MAGRIQSHNLVGRSILVVEDEFFIADDLNAVLREMGAEVIGPVPTSSKALQLLSERVIDFAVLDINLEGEMVFSLADTLKMRDIPFVFATGYGSQRIPERFRDIPRWQKPFDGAELAVSLASAMS